jgi:diketogulonate reductase-like aldo/keto reductase
LVGSPALQQIADALSATPAQVALAWLLRRKNLIAIPKAGTAAHACENAGAADLHLDDEVLNALDRAFPAPDRPGPLEML